MSDTLEELLVVNDVALAHILNGRLQADGIDSHLFDTGFSGLLGGGFPGIRLMVPAAQLARARWLLDLPDSEA